MPIIATLTALRSSLSILKERVSAIELGLRGVDKIQVVHQVTEHLHVLLLHLNLLPLLLLRDGLVELFEAANRALDVFLRFQSLALELQLLNAFVFFLGPIRRPNSAQLVVEQTDLAVVSFVRHHCLCHRGWPAL